MPDVDIEGKLRLSFPDEWQALKLDDELWYRQHLKLGLRAVDVVAARDSRHWWIEVKDCLGHEPANRPRLDPAEPQAVEDARRLLQEHALDKVVRVRRAKPFIVDEVVEKVVGSLVCVTTAHRASGGLVDAARLAAFAGVLAPAISWNVVLLLAWDSTEFARLARLLAAKLSQRLSGFNVKCFVVNEHQAAPAQPWKVSRIGT